ncbi:glycosyltransferase [Halovulum sp. GXIMD14794]
MQLQVPFKAPPTASATVRPRVRGKFLFLGDRKLYIRGVTYGTFASSPETGDFPPRATVASDFSAIARMGANAVRVYIVPPMWLLDIAKDHGLVVLVGLPWEQHVAFLDEPTRAEDIERRLEAAIRPIAGHPAILAFAVGNEIPASVVRWHGRNRVSEFLARLASMVRRMDPGALVTYVNFPTTEYLDLSFSDFVSFNVYLEDMERLSAYLARLQNIAGEKPLLMGEIGLDSHRNGLEKQASSLASQLRTVFEAGVAGAFVFAWTDEWHRSGHEITDWDFGLVDRDRHPKPALDAVSAEFARVPIAREHWPRISVVVCSYNGGRTIAETLDHLSRLEYPDYEIIVVNDGSTDGTAAIADREGVHLISTENRGLSAARNTGFENATGEIVAYIDDDAYPDPHWLHYLAQGFKSPDIHAVGGPNLAPPEDPDLAECVANAPGGPIHVLSSDDVAEHIPGCNMSFRRNALVAIGGFDPRFRVAGDDVDVCWRIEEAGGVIGFSHSAMVWHHRRPSIATYLKQQRGYARAEALLAEKWPNRYNRAGHLTWVGQLYGRGKLQSLFSPQHIYFGRWGTAPFQSIYGSRETTAGALPLMPEWAALTIILLTLGVFGFDWPVLFIALALGLGALALSVTMAIRGAKLAQFETSYPEVPPRRPDWQLRAIVFALHLLQPLHRLIGRIRFRLGPWGSGHARLRPVARYRRMEWWTEAWTDSSKVVERLRAAIENQPHVSGGDFDDWDLAVGPTIFGEIRLLVMNEDHGGGQQLYRLKSWPVVFRPVWLLLALFAGLSVAAALSGAWIAATALGMALMVLAMIVWSALSQADAILLENIAPAFLNE